MAKSRDPLLEALRKGRAFTWTIPDGGDLASMRAAVKHGQTLTMSPVIDVDEVRAGDIVLVRWHGGHLFHLVQEIEGDQFLIANSLGKVNGWVAGDAILGRVTEVVEPAPRAPVPVMLDRLDAAFRDLVDRERPDESDLRGLRAIADAMRSYAERIGPDRWEETPRQNTWTFGQRLWNLTKRASSGASVRVCIDRGHVCVGLVAELVMLWEANELAAEDAPRIPATEDQEAT